MEPRQPLVPRAALALRRALFPPGGPAEAYYRRLIRPLGRRLLPRPGAPGIPRIAAWPSPVLGGTVRRVLLLKLDHIGDFLLAAPAFAALRHGLPQAHITLLCGPWNTALAERSGWFDAVVPFAFFAPRADAAPPAPNLDALVCLGAFDLAADLRVDADTRQILARIPARITAAYASPWMKELSIALDPARASSAARTSLEAHQRRLLLDLAAAILAQDFGGHTAALLRATPAPGAASIGARPLIALNPGSGRAIKNWPLARFAALAARLRAERGATLLLLGGPDQRADADRLLEALGPDRVVDRVGRLELVESLALLDQADFYIGNDTALGHAAAALGKPTLVLFSGVDELHAWAPLGPRAIALKADLGCAPCHLSDLSLCPNGHLCMSALSVEAAWDAVCALGV